MDYSEASLVLLPSPSLQSSFIFEWELRPFGQCQASSIGSANLWLDCATLAQPMGLSLDVPCRASVLCFSTGWRSSPKHEVQLSKNLVQP